jgi:hypothetical protein
MKRSRLFLSALCLALVVSLAILPLSAADKADNKITGTIKMINKDASTLTVRPRNSANTKTVVYSADTKITLRTKPATMDAVKEGRRVICLGKLDDKNRLVATHIDVRSE